MYTACMCVMYSMYVCMYSMCDGQSVCCCLRLQKDDTRLHGNRLFLLLLWFAHAKTSTVATAKGHSVRVSQACGYSTSIVVCVSISRAVHVCMYSTYVCLTVSLHTGRHVSQPGSSHVS